MKALRITNWERFEKSDSRKCTSMSWVAVPINHEGLGYLELMSHPDGIRMIGGWLLILQVAARCPTRGLLVADSGRVLGAREIALKTRSQEKDISACIKILLANGWLEHQEISGQHPDDIRTTSGLQDITLQDKTGQESVRADAAPIPSKRFTPPTLADVEDYCRERKNDVAPEKWYNHYEANGWKVGRNGMKSWQAAVRKWETKRDSYELPSESEVREALGIDNG